MSISHDTLCCKFSMIEKIAIFKKPERGESIKTMCTQNTKILNTPLKLSKYICLKNIWKEK